MAGFGTPEVWGRVAGFGTPEVRGCVVGFRSRPAIKGGCGQKSSEKAEHFISERQAVAQELRWT